MQKPKEHLQLAVCLHSKAIERSQVHNTEVSYVQSAWCIITVSWKFRMIHRFCCLKCCWIASSQVFDACSAGVRSNSIMQYLLHWTPATGHRLTPWISWLRCTVQRLLLLSSWWKPPVTFMYSCSFLPVVSFSDLLLLQHTHTTAKLILLLPSIA